MKIVVLGCFNTQSASAALRARTDSQTRQQIELEFVDQEISDITKSLETSETDLSELSEQKGKLDTAFDREFTMLAELETPYKDLLGTRRTIRQTVTSLTDRNDEISLLLDRFEMLSAH